MFQRRYQNTTSEFTPGDLAYTSKEDEGGGGAAPLPGQEEEGAGRAPPLPGEKEDGSFKGGQRNLRA